MEPFYLVGTTYLQTVWHSCFVTRRWPIEFSLNGFHWIQWIQWIMTESKICLVSKGNTHLPTSMLPAVVVLRAFPRLSLVWCLLPLTTLNRYQTRDSNANFIFTDHVRSTREGYVLTRVFLSVCLSTGGYPTWLGGRLPQPGGTPAWFRWGYPGQVQMGGTPTRSRWGYPSEFNDFGESNLEKTIALSGNLRCVLVIKFNIRSY